MSNVTKAPIAAVQPPFKLERYFAEFEFNTRYLLSSSDPESVTMKELLHFADEECKQLWNNLSLGYTEMKGHPLLLKEAAKIHGLKPENILVSAPQEAIYLVSKTIANLFSKKHPDAGVHVVTTFPSYQSLYQNLVTFGCEVDFWKPRHNEDDSSWKFDLEDLQTLFKDNTRILVINFPHNPTGFLPSEEEFLELIDICRKKNIFLFSDEMYRLTNNDGSSAYPSAAQVYDNAISLFGVSKTFGLPGLRIGWMASQNTDILLKIETLKDYITMCCSAPSEILAIIALRNKDKLIERTMGFIQHNLDLLDGFMSKYQNLFAWHRPRACTTGFIQLKEPLLKLGKGSAKGFCELLRQEAEILMLPGAMYDYPDQFVRIGFGRANLPEALNALEQFIVAHELK